MLPETKRNGKKKVGTIYKPIKAITRNDTLLSFNILSSKKMDKEYRKQYLEKMTELFTVKELLQKWSTNEATIYKFFINNEVPIFEEKNQIEREFNALLADPTVNNREIRRRLVELLTKYKTGDVLNHYRITIHTLIDYLKYFGIDYMDYRKDGEEEVPENFSLAPNAINTAIKREEKKETMNTTYDVVTKVNMQDGLVEEIKYVPVNVPKVVSVNRSTAKEMEEKYKTPISIITFLNLPEKERTDRLNKLVNDYNLKSDEIEKILGIPSGPFYRKLKARHMIFDFYNKDKLKDTFKKTCKTFEDCQNVVFYIIKNKEFSKYKVSEKTFIKFADDYFDVSVSKLNGLSFDNYEAFCKKIIKQAIYVYKKNSRVTNLTDAEVIEFERNNRKVISTTNLIAIAREVIKSLYKENHSWISIFDFKTEIEKNGFELDSNDRLIEVIDNLIEKKSFKNDYFTLKKITMENPILSDDSSVRWEFVSTIVKKQPELVEEPTPVIEKEPEPVVVDEFKDFIGEDYHDESENEVAITVESTVAPVRNSFLTSTSFELEYNDENVDEVIDYIKNTFKFFGGGKVAIVMSK